MYRFEDYDLIIDARCEREFAEDHIPGAINLPVVNNDEYAEVGTLHRTDKMRAYLIGVSYSLKNISRHLDTVIASRSRRDKILVYCFRGGKRSRLWFDALDTVGYKVDRLPGGWKGYRRWVNEQLESRPRQFSYVVLSGPTGCGKTRLLEQLAIEGAQVLDLEAIASHRGSIIGAIPGVPQPTQKYFDSLLLQRLSAFSPSRPVWVEAESKKIGNVQLPPALLETMHSSGTVLRVDAPMAERVRLWREDYAHFETDPDSLVERLTHLRSLVGGKEIDLWRELAATRKIPELFERLMVAHYDPSYARSTKRGYQSLSDAPFIALKALQPASLNQVARNLINRFD
ncbi:tRNA 2-selenouridine(34) synthase MnmH [Paraburkholderia sp. J63]|uniref:tRNA 2-selenouridine(34) synthase MnmH n=1 Tax=Paraburkholderia sp. J63 TaxID=2805434 RepID=UPI002ABE1A0F|nr:tRNA 2-selenouridine(34) synthase MnmH [Paraburkholderia sp. J63]